jgi:hypothetical protein
MGGTLSYLWGGDGGRKKKEQTIVRTDEKTNEMAYLKIRPLFIRYLLCSMISGQQKVNERHFERYRWLEGPELNVLLVLALLPQVAAALAEHSGPSDGGLNARHQNAQMDLVRCEREEWRRQDMKEEEKQRKEG